MSDAAAAKLKKINPRSIDRLMGKPKMTIQLEHNTVLAEPKRRH
jgi:hypothetical protein